MSAAASLEVNVSVGNVPVRIYLDAKCAPDAGCSPVMCLQISSLPPLCRGV